VIDAGRRSSAVGGGPLGAPHPGAPNVRPPRREYRGVSTVRTRPATTGPGTAGPAGGGPVAEQLAGMPGVWRRLLDAHVPDLLGRCTACRTAGGSGALWPCRLHVVATDARRWHGLLLGRAVAGDGAAAQEPGRE
jgi:hypothetical protein